MHHPPITKRKYVHRGWVNSTDESIPRCSQIRISYSLWGLNINWNKKILCFVFLLIFTSSCKTVHHCKKKRKRNWECAPSREVLLVIQVQEGVIFIDDNYLLPRMRSLRGILKSRPCLLKRAIARRSIRLSCGLILNFPVKT